MAVKKIAIIGTSPSCKKAPYGDRSWEIWSFNRTCFDLKRWDRLFEIHQKWDYEPDPKAYLDRLKKVKPPKKVMSIIPLGGPANIVIDREALFKKYGAIWISSSITYAIACALEEKPTDIGLWGIDMESREEYVVQFAGCRHFIDMAKVLGIKIHLPHDCLLRRDPHPYADRFETTLALTLESKAKYIEKLIDRVECQLSAAEAGMNQRLGRIREMYLHADLPYEDVDKQEAKAAEDKWYVEKLTASLNRLRGELIATQHYKRLFVWNVLPPEFGEETTTDIEDCGPI
ncbi:MAG TPA: hypothetical protein ENH55_13265 [Aurantimonas coralicida]|uniref:Uncharacterized protein n=2 Tax=root TaxID=1 RepID=A0A9C9TGE7_9HYPH|nr:hypothetical protein [Aurantimonas coralicida]HET99670.1 hypothetical protein [Aurantimonas coralicida]